MNIFMSLNIFFFFLFLSATLLLWQFAFVCFWRDILNQNFKYIIFPGKVDLVLVENTLP